MRYWLPMRLDWSETLIKGDEVEAQLKVRLDLETVEATRAKIPIFADGQPELS